MMSLYPREDLFFPPQAHRVGDSHLNLVLVWSPCSWGLAIQGTGRRACCTLCPTPLAGLKLGSWFPRHRETALNGSAFQKVSSLAFQPPAPCRFSKCSKGKLAVCLQSLKCPVSLQLRKTTKSSAGVSVSPAVVLGWEKPRYSASCPGSESQISPVAAEVKSTIITSEGLFFALRNLSASSFHCFGCSLMSVSRLFSVYLVFSYCSWQSVILWQLL